MKLALISAAILGLSAHVNAIEYVNSSNFDVGVKKEVVNNYRSDHVVFDVYSRNTILQTINQGADEFGSFNRMVDLAKASDPYASYYVGLTHIFGAGTKVDVSEGLDYLENAHDYAREDSREYREATLLLADIYSGYRDIEKAGNQLFEPTLRMKAKATELLYESAVAGHPVAERRLAEYYWEGERGFTRDRDLALMWLARSVQKGDDLSQKMMQQWYGEVQSGQTYAMKKIELTRGNGDSMIDVAKMFYMGDGVPMDKERAIRMIRDAAAMKIKGADVLYLDWSAK